MKAIWTASALAAILIAHDVAYSQGQEPGRIQYLYSCASCHGPTGKGDGTIAKLLKRPPADLTKFSEANKGVFPFSRIYDAIDGRLDIEAHGTREMPAWGQLYQPWDSSKAGPVPYVSNELGEAIVRDRILALVAYIATLQGK
jgi:mono/diheme cytochrome c family protein